MCLRASLIVMTSWTELGNSRDSEGKDIRLVDLMFCERAVTTLGRGRIPRDCHRTLVFGPKSLRRTVWNIVVAFDLLLEPCNKVSDIHVFVFASLIPMVPP